MLFSDFYRFIASQSHALWYKQDGEIPGEQGVTNLGLKFRHNGLGVMECRMPMTGQVDRNILMFI